MIRGRFESVNLVDFEYDAPDGEPPKPLCCVVHELLTGRRVRLWKDEFGPTPPYATDERSLFVSYYAPAELSCHLALGWPLPVNVLDLFTEYRRKTNGTSPVGGGTLVGALEYHGLPSIGAAEKERMRALILRGEPFTPEERDDILDYCESDVVALEHLLEAMDPDITPELERALLRGRFMCAVARMEAVGVPIDTAMLTALTGRWDEILRQLVAEVDVDFDIFEGTHFREARFERWLSNAQMDWPRQESGRPKLDDETFKEMATLHPRIEPLRQLRKMLGQMRPARLAVGGDGRNRVMLSAFASKTGRNQPSSGAFIFGQPAWSRSLITPPPGHALAYIDWEQQEFGIAAASSGDGSMAEAYRTGDPYLAFAMQAKAVPADATKDSHPTTRELFKQAALAVLYGMGVDGLARRLGISRADAAELLRLHRSVYRRFWEWSDAVVDGAMLFSRLRTALGWEIHITDGVNTRMLRNFPMQANGAEMMRVAAILMTERGVRVCAPVHDAFLIEAPLDEIAEATRAARAAMAEASAGVLGGFDLRTEVKITRFPDRFVESRGEAMWKRVAEVLHKVRSTS